MLRRPGSATAGTCREHGNKVIIVTSIRRGERSCGGAVAEDKVQYLKVLDHTNLIGKDLIAAVGGRRLLQFDVMLKY